MKKWLKLIIIAFVLIGLIFAARSFELDKYLSEIQSWILAQGILAPLIVIILYVIATVLALPGSALTIMAGAILGSLVGIIVVLIGATLGASLCFLISRYIARGYVENILGDNEKFQKLDRLTEKNGIIIVAITRLVPIFPFNLLNYGFGLTKIPFRVFVLWSAICMLPGIILYVVGTDAIISGIRDGEIPWALIAVIIFIIVVLTVAVRKAKSTLKE